MSKLQTYESLRNLSRRLGIVFFFVSGFIYLVLLLFAYVSLCQIHLFIEFSVNILSINWIRTLQIKRYRKAAENDTNSFKIR